MTKSFDQGKINTFRHDILKVYKCRMSSINIYHNKILDF